MTPIDIETPPELSTSQIRQARPDTANVSPAAVLVVDDTPMNVKLLRDLLAVRGYQVETADSGEAALRMVTQWQQVFAWLPAEGRQDKLLAVRRTSFK